MPLLKKESNTTGNTSIRERDLEYQAKAYLDKINSIIRVNRDDVGHARAARVDRQLAYGNLTIYPTLLSLTRELADALGEAQPCAKYPTI